MAKKLSFDDLPTAVEKILEILTSEGSDHTALPELVRRTTLLEKKIDCLQKIVSPNRPTMDMQTVCKVLKLRPKIVSELAMSGELPSHAEGRKTLFYEDDVVKFFMTLPAWKAANSKPSPVESIPTEISAEGRQRVDPKAAAVILDRSTAAVYQLVSNGRIPHHKEGSKTYFFTDELREWAMNNPPRKHKLKM